MPVVFSTAFPAMPTITSPANAFGTPIRFIAGVRAVTNQSDTNAAPTPESASSATARRIEIRGSLRGSSCRASERR
jgi:hypothetical protein